MTYKCAICREWHAVTSIVTFGGVEIRECPNINKYFPNAESVMFNPKDCFDLYGNSVRPFAVPASSGKAIPDFGEPKKFL